MGMQINAKNVILIAIFACTQFAQARDIKITPRQNLYNTVMSANPGDRVILSKGLYKIGNRFPFKSGVSIVGTGKSETFGQNVKNQITIQASKATNYRSPSSLSSMTFERLDFKNIYFSYNGKFIKKFNLAPPRSIKNIRYLNCRFFGGAAKSLSYIDFQRAESVIIADCHFRADFRTLRPNEGGMGYYGDNRCPSAVTGADSKNITFSRNDGYGSIRKFCGFGRSLNIKAQQSRIDFRMHPGHTDHGIYFASGKNYTIDRVIIRNLNRTFEQSFKLKNTHNSVVKESRGLGGGGAHLLVVNMPDDRDLNGFIVNGTSNLVIRNVLLEGKASNIEFAQSPWQDGRSGNDYKRFQGIEKSIQITDTTVKTGRIHIKGTESKRLFSKDQFNTPSSFLGINGHAKYKGYGGIFNCRTKYSHDMKGVRTRVPSGDPPVTIDPSTPPPNNNQAFLNSIIGKKFAFKANNGKFFAHMDGRKDLICNRSTAGSWTIFTVIDVGGGKIALRGSNGKYVSSQNGAKDMVCNSSRIGSWEKFIPVSTSGKIAFKGNNNRYVTSNNGTKDMRCSSSRIGSYERFTLVRK